MRWTIRAKLGALVLAVLLPLVAGAAFKFWRDLAQGREEAQTNMLATAQIVARHLDEVLSGQIENLQALASARSLHRIEDEDLRTVAARVRVQHPFVHRFFTARPDGIVTASSNAWVPESVSRFGDTELPGAVLRENEPRVGTPQPSATELATGAPAGAGNGRCALVVDDEPSVVELVATLLRQAGWQVDVATGGHAALARPRDSRYDLVVSDVRMPDGGGEELYRAATADERDMVSRFLFMTGDTANPETWEFLEASRAHVLEKPFTAQALLSAVERATT